MPGPFGLRFTHDKEGRRNRGRLTHPTRKAHPMGGSHDYRSENRWLILKALAEASGPLDRQTIHDLTGATNTSIRDTMIRPIRAGWVTVREVPRSTGFGRKYLYGITNLGRAALAESPYGKHKDESAADWIRRELAKAMPNSPTTTHVKIKATSPAGESKWVSVPVDVYRRVIVAACTTDTEG